MVYDSGMMRPAVMHYAARSVWRDWLAKRRRLTLIGNLIAKIRKWLGMEKKP